MYRTLLILVASHLTYRSSSQDIPIPSGSSKIGYHHFEWVDSARTEILSPDNRQRQVSADIWYPAESSTLASVPYLDTVPIYRTFGPTGLRSLLGAHGAALIRSGTVHTHAVKDVPFSHQINTAPIITYSHGMGMTTQLYTTQIEDLVSHGYVVIALNHPYDAWLVSFADGHDIAFETKQRKSAGISEEEHIAYENKRLEWWAGDIKFVLNKLTELNRKHSGFPFAGHLDLNHIGAMGHSAGGRAAARACQLDNRIKSCADQDGVAMMLPFYVDKEGKGMEQPFLLFERDRNLPPTEDELKQMGMSRHEVDSLVSVLRANRDAALASAGGSFRVVLNFDSSSHMSFSDLPVLQAKNSLQLAAAYHLLKITCRYTREFFDKTLRGMKAPLYKDLAPTAYIDLIRQYSNNSKNVVVPVK